MRILTLAVAAEAYRVLSLKKLDLLKRRTEAYEGLRALDAGLHACDEELGDAQRDLLRASGGLVYDSERDEFQIADAMLAERDK